MIKYIFLSLIFFSSIGQTEQLTVFESCYQVRAGSVPSKPEREFLDSYLNYLKKGSKINGELAISNMQELATSQGGQFSIEWASIFEGAIGLCCGGPQACTEGFGSISLKVLYPRVKKGWVTALFLVLMYERLAKTDGADSSGLNNYLKLIKEKHPWVISLFKQKYP